MGLGARARDRAGGAHGSLGSLALALLDSRAARANLPCPHGTVCHPLDSRAAERQIAVGLKLDVGRTHQVDAPPPCCSAVPHGRPGLPCGVMASPPDRREGRRGLNRACIYSPQAGVVGRATHPASDIRTRHTRADTLPARAPVPRPVAPAHRGRRWCRRARSQYTSHSGCLHQRLGAPRRSSRPNTSSAGAVPAARHAPSLQTLARHWLRTATQQTPDLLAEGNHLDRRMGFGSRVCIYTSPCPSRVRMRPASASSTHRRHVVVSRTYSPSTSGIHS